jgi:hypothetical protein
MTSYLHLKLFRARRNERCIANVRNLNFQLDAVSCIRRLRGPRTHRFSIRYSNGHL